MTLFLFFAVILGVLNTHGGHSRYKKKFHKYKASDAAHKDVSVVISPFNISKFFILGGHQNVSSLDDNMTLKRGIIQNYDPSTRIFSNFSLLPVGFPYEFHPTSVQQIGKINF